MKLKTNTDWFMESKYGIFVHYLDGIQNDPDNPRGLSCGRKTTWDDCVSEFNTEIFAEQVAETGAAYTFFTVMQRTRHMCAPNSTYDCYTGYKPGEACSQRDLIKDVYDSLNKRGIKLMLYTTGDGPYGDERASMGLKGGFPWNLNAEYSKRWSECMGELSKRYGGKISGWWVDGCYKSIGFSDTTFFDSMSFELKSGNPDSIVGFNYWAGQEGYNGEVLPVTSYEDYTAGEIYQGLDNNHPYPQTRWAGDEQWHVLVFLGNDWGFPDTRYPDNFLVEYVKKCNENGGVVSLDVGLQRDGRLSDKQLKQLVRLKYK